MAYQRCGSRDDLLQVQAINGAVLSVENLEIEVKPTKCGLIFITDKHSYTKQCHKFSD